MSDQALRAGLIRLAHSHPEFRKDLLPLIKEACGTGEAPMMGKFEEGKPADPTKHMSPEDAAEWKKQTELNKSNFKGATTGKSSGCEKLPEGGMRDNCEKKKEEGAKSDKEASAKKKAGMAIIRRTTSIAVRVLSHKTTGDIIEMKGQMSIDFGGDIQPDAVRFVALVRQTPEGYFVNNFQTQRAVSGGGADILLGVLKNALQEALTTRGEALLGALEVV